MDGPEQTGGSSAPPRKTLAPATGKLTPNDGLGKKSVPSGSATGNPRNKTALAPGHSLMDWIRLGSSGKDLTGVGGKPRPVDRAELEKHSTEDDAWLAIRGKVFNVTHYLDFHPGGRDELMRGAGRDATALFDSAHAWVNYESLLQKCFVGPLSSAATEQEHQDLRDLFGSSGNKNKSKSTPFATPNNIKPVSSGFATPDVPKTPKQNNEFVNPAEITANMSKPKSSLKTKQQPDKSEAEPREVPQREEPVYAITDNNNQKKEEIVTEKPDVVVTPPRFDWMQITSRVTYIFYTHPFANPHVRVSKKSEESDELEVVLGFDNAYFIFDLVPLHPLIFPCVVVITQHTGKVELKFEKVRRCIWENFGTIVRHSPLDADDEYREYVSISLTDVGRNTYIIAMNGDQPEVSTYPLGSYFKLTVDGIDKKRFYTPISRYFDEEISPKIRTVTLIVKLYPDGKLTPALTSGVGVKVRLYAPKLPFDLATTYMHSRFLFISGGTGIAPFLDVILYLLQRKDGTTMDILFIIYDRTEEDMLCREKLDQLATEHCAFNVIRVLTRPSDAWTGPVGRVNECKLKDMLSGRPKATLALTCGPPKFMESVVKSLKKLKFSQSDIMVFG